MQLKPARRLAAALLCAAAAVAALPAQNTLSQLGLEEPQAKKALLTSVTSGTVYLGGAAARAFRGAPAATQKALIDGAIRWAKAFTATPEFRRAYAAQRDAARPKAPDAVQSGLPDAKQQAEIEKMKKTAASLPAEQRQALEEAIKAMEAMQNDPQMRQLLEQGAVMARKGAEESHQRELVRWNENFPEDPDVLIARRLRTFLDVSGSVDFSAKLVPSGTTMKFADPKYEAKPGEWKMCYRAGAEGVAAARAAAAAWLEAIAPK
jgi:hypothetical protein